jgi:hypothetical protein
MILKLAMSVVALLAGGWMTFDGIHVLVCGKYFGPERPGPWSVPFARLGVNPFSLGPLFIGLGLLWLAFAVAALAGRGWGRTGGAAIAIASLWYFPLGTILSLIYLVLLYATRAG